MSARFLITGTDTGIGKTTVGCAIAAALRRRGIEVGVIKPIETGCAPSAGGLVAADAQQLAWFAGRSDALDRICPVRLPDALAPLVAARREGLELSLRALADAVDRHSKTCDVQLVEGAGGLLVPITAHQTFADLAAACDLALIVVIGNRLGCVNHASLTMRWAASAGLRIAGYILNTVHAAPDLAADTNAALLAELHGPSLGVLPWLGSIRSEESDRHHLADAAEQHLRLDALLA